MRDIEVRADWSLRDAILWIKDRNENRLSDPAFQLPSLTAWRLFPTMGGNGRYFAQAAEILMVALKAGHLQARRLSATGIETPIAAGYWNSKSIGNHDHSDPAIVLAAIDVKTAFPSPVESNEVQAVRQPGRTTAAAEHECKAWLLQQFKADVSGKRTKSSFKGEALKYFDERLSRRAFDRAWAAVAPNAGRSEPGRKS